MLTAEPMLSISDTAASRLQDYLNDHELENGSLRVFVAPGGCSGLQYGMVVETEVEPDDWCITTKNVNLVIDAFSAEYLKGAEVDYRDSLMGGGFTIHNPNAVASCACGHSFDTGGDMETAHGCSR